MSCEQLQDHTSLKQFDIDTLFTDVGKPLANTFIILGIKDNHSDFNSPLNPEIIDVYPQSVSVERINLVIISLRIELYMFSRML